MPIGLTGLIPKVREISIKKTFLTTEERADMNC